MNRFFLSDSTDFIVLLTPSEVFPRREARRHEEEARKACITPPLWNHNTLYGGVSDAPLSSKHPITTDARDAHNTASRRHPTLAVTLQIKIKHGRLPFPALKKKDCLFPVQPFI
jgi:hypothetical protein